MFKSYGQPEKAQQFPAEPGACFIDTTKRTMHAIWVVFVKGLDPFMQPVRTGLNEDMADGREELEIAVGCPVALAATGPLFPSERTFPNSLSAR